VKVKCGCPLDDEPLPNPLLKKERGYEPPRFTCDKLEQL